MTDYMKRGISQSVRGRRPQGFTLVELVAIILLVGIMGVVAISRYTSPNAFNAQGAQDALIATIRQAQQAALGREEVVFEIDSTASEHSFIVKSGGDELSRALASKSGVLLTTGTADADPDNDSCSTNTLFTDEISTLALEFDAMGNLATFAYNGGPAEDNDGVLPFNGVRICVNAVVEASVCVSPAGYAYEGNCEP